MRSIVQSALIAALASATDFYEGDGCAAANDNGDKLYSSLIRYKFENGGSWIYMENEVKVESDSGDFNSKADIGVGNCVLV